ncbi:MAG: thioredoxin family protein [Armatimonadetes bacterium]|nr:thioredoxin family protein [Armatimonadota bacterium]
MRIEILGKGCEKCRRLAANAEQAARELGVEAEIVKVTDPAQISRYGPLMTPVLVVDGRICSTGKALSPRAVAQLLRQAMGEGPAAPAGSRPRAMWPRQSYQ